MQLSDYVNTFGAYSLRRFGARVHKLSINARFTCPNRDGARGRGGCTFCNNASFNPNTRRPPDVGEQLQAGRSVVKRRTGATLYLAYFQAYTNTYAELGTLKSLYDRALAEPDVIGLAVGTRPDCVPDPVLDLLADYRDRGREVWLELGLQSAFDATLNKVNRGHGFAEYADAVQRARQRGLPVCCHLIVGLPGERPEHSLSSHTRVLELGVEGLKIHPLHVVRNTVLAHQWRRGEYAPLAMSDYIDVVTEIVRHTPPEVVFHRVTGTAKPPLLLAPDWCRYKWRVLNAVTLALHEKTSFLRKSTGALDGTGLPGGKPARPEVRRR